MKHLFTLILLFSVCICFAQVAPQQTDSTDSQAAQPITLVQGNNSYIVSKNSTIVLKKAEFSLIFTTKKKRFPYGPHVYYISTINKEKAAEWQRKRFFEISGVHPASNWALELGNPNEELMITDGRVEDEDLMGFCALWYDKKTKKNTFNDIKVLKDSYWSVLIVDKINSKGVTTKIADFNEEFIFLKIVYIDEVYHLTLKIPNTL
jgi:hypothetical protein